MRLSLVVAFLALGCAAASADPFQPPDFTTGDPFSLHVTATNCGACGPVGLPHPDVTLVADLVVAQMTGEVWFPPIIGNYVPILTYTPTVLAVLSITGTYNDHIITGLAPLNPIYGDTSWLLFGSPMLLDFTIQDIGPARIMQDGFLRFITADGNQTGLSWTATVPEPSSFVLLASGALLMMLAHHVTRRRTRVAAIASLQAPTREQ